MSVVCPRRIPHCTFGGHRSLGDIKGNLYRRTPRKIALEGDAFPLRRSSEPIRFSPQQRKMVDLERSRRRDLLPLTRRSALALSPLWEKKPTELKFVRGGVLTYHTCDNVMRYRAGGTWSRFFFSLCLFLSFSWMWPRP